MSARRAYDVTGAGPKHGAELAMVPPETAALKAYVRSVRANQRRVVMCKAQCRLVARRLGVIYETLMRLPNPRPTPGLLSAFQCGAFLLSTMCAGAANNDNWLVAMRLRFVATAVFSSFWRRLRCVWQLQPTGGWAAEDAAARQQDEEDALDTLIGNAKTFEGTPLALPRAAIGGGSHNSSNSTANNSGKPASGGKPLNANTDAGAAAVAATGAFAAGHGDGSAASADTIDRAALLAALRRSAGCGSWKVAPEEVVAKDPQPFEYHLYNPHRKPNNSRRASSTAPAQEKSATIAAVAVPSPFEVFLNCTFAEVPFCVLKQLRSPSAYGPAAICQTLEAFVMDMSARVGWCHPGLVHTYGGFGERAFDLSPRGGGGSGGDGAAASTILPSPGIVLEQLPTTAVVSAHAQRHDAMSSFPASWEASPHLFTTLHEMLYATCVGLSLVDALDIIAQLADAQHYLSLDADEVPSAVAAAWYTVCPSNVYVRDVTKPRSTEDGDATTAVALERPSSRRFEVRLLPRLFVAGAPVNRWSSPAAAVSHPAVYSLAQLLTCLVRGTVPFPAALTQRELQEVLVTQNGTATAAAVGGASPPRDNFATWSPPQIAETRGDALVSVPTLSALSAIGGIDTSFSMRDSSASEPCTPLTGAVCGVAVPRDASTMPDALAHFLQRCLALHGAPSFGAADGGAAPPRSIGLQEFRTMVDAVLLECVQDDHFGAYTAAGPSFCLPAEHALEHGLVSRAGGGPGRDSHAW